MGVLVSARPAASPSPPRAPSLSRALTLLESVRVCVTSPVLSPRPPFHLTPPSPLSAHRRPPLPREERRAVAAGKRKVCAAQSDAKILKELFGGGYLEIRPCEGPRVQIPALGRSSRTGSGRPGCLEGGRVAPPPRAPGPASPRTPGRCVRFHSCF